MALRAGHDVIVSDFDALGVFALKTANESVTSSTTLQNDDQLVLAVAASAKYFMEMFIPYTGAASPAGDLKMGFTGPSGATMTWANFGVNSSALTAYNVVGEALAGGRAVGTNGATTMCCQPKGYLQTSTTSGNLQFQWAQNSSSGTATTILAGALLKLTRIA
jgi:hypothetical protein